MVEFQNRFHAGQLIHHTKFDDRGVIVGVDQTFQHPDEWYEQVAKSRPPKDRPWYHVLVHGSGHTTYVAERHLELANDREPIEHPQLDHYFDTFNDGFYSNSREQN